MRYVLIVVGVLIAVAVGLCAGVADADRSGRRHRRPQSRLHRTLRAERRVAQRALARRGDRAGPRRRLGQGRLRLHGTRRRAYRPCTDRRPNADGPGADSAGVPGIDRASERVARHAVETVANTHGRPLGLQHDPFGNIVVADAKKGLLAITPQGKIVVVAERFEDRPLKFVDDLDIAKDGTIYFSDASQRYGIDEYTLDFLEGQGDGAVVLVRSAIGHVAGALDGIWRSPTASRSGRTRNTCW